MGRHYSELSQGHCYGCGLEADSAANTCQCILPSPLVHHSVGYCAPDSLETARSVVEQGDTKLATLDEAFQRLQSYRDEIHRSIIPYRNYLAPISRLPDDILLLVFVEALCVEEGTLQGDTVWNLTVVCARWRSLAISCSRIWAGLVLVLGWEANQPTEHEEGIALLACRRALIQLEREKVQPLDFCMDLPCAYDEDIELRFPSLSSPLRRIIAHLHHSSRITLLGGSLTWQLFSSTTPPTFTLLRELHLQYPGKRRKEARLFPDFFKDTPALERINLSTMKLNPPYPPSWNSLTTLEMSYCSLKVADFVDLLRFTEKLTRLFVGPRMRAFAGELPPITKPINLPYLDYLEVDFSSHLLRHCRDQQMRSVIENIRCPNLTTVYLSAPTKLYLESVQACIRSSDNLSSVLWITFASVDEQGLADPISSLIQELPSLTFICVHLVGEDHDDNYDPLVDALWEDSSALCPHLEHLELVGCHITGHTTLTEMIQTRASCSSLRHVVLEKLSFTDTQTDLTDLEWLENERDCFGQELETLTIT